ncbi:GTP-binding protein [Cyclospora cayetanensis]|uniref:GTP-binding protein n=1 Tax=Cyclospora cayetanensis TaxID=88456 RepID=A0A1D3D0F1_9EIME|nr:GTP-binding protein [Cyclospora cayetanensis]
MSTVLQKIAEVENEIARTQKNKATNYHLGLLKAKLAKLRGQLIEGSCKRGGGGGEGFDVSKTGDARVGLVGFPSVGKSTLLNKLTGTFSEVAAYEFTTLTCVPGVFKYKGAKVQLLDLPGIIEGGISVTHTVPLTHLDEETVRSICQEYRIMNAQVALRCDATADELIDVIEGNRLYVPCVYAINKIDQITIEELDILQQVPHYVPISAQMELNLDGLLEKIWEYLDLVRVYTKPKGQIPDYTAPVILNSSRSKVEDFCMRIHKSLLEEFKQAIVWGKSVKHNPQKVGREHQLVDEDVVQIIKK